MRKTNHNTHTSLSFSVLCKHLHSQSGLGIIFVSSALCSRWLRLLVGAFIIKRRKLFTFIYLSNKHTLFKENWICLYRRCSACVMRSQQVLTKQTKDFFLVFSSTTVIEKNNNNVKFGICMPSIVMQFRFKELVNKNANNFSNYNWFEIKHRCFCRHSIPFQRIRMHRMRVSIRIH